MEPDKKIILDILYTIPDIFPVKMNRPFKDRNGLIYDKVLHSALDGEIVIESAPVNGGNVKTGVSHFTVHRLLGILRDLVKAWRAKHDIREWDFIRDEERYTPDGRLFWAGLLTNGKDYLYWRTDPTEHNGDETFCHIYNSILMDDDSEECCYPWSAENDELVVNGLNSDPENYSGDDSALRQIEFRPVTWNEKHIDLEYTRKLLLVPGSPFGGVEYDGKADILTLHAKRKEGTLVTQTFHLHCDQGYYRAHYETDRGPADFANMFRGNTDTSPDIAGECYAESDDPDILYTVLDACDKTDFSPAFIEIQYPE